MGDYHARFCERFKVKLLLSTRLDVNIHIPAKTFTGRTRLIVVPQLLQKDSMLAEYTPMVFDAPIYSK